MDVHPPHQPIHSWKDFGLHLLTITIGLFIALTLESSIEALHHRHLVREAQDNLRQEISANHELYTINVQRLQKNQARLAHDIDQLGQLRHGAVSEHPDLSWTWEWDSYADAAWSTARDSGAITYMSAAQIGVYSSVYAQQQYINATALALMTEETKASGALEVAASPSGLTTSETESLLIKSAELHQSFATLQRTMSSLDHFYVEALRSR